MKQWNGRWLKGRRWAESLEEIRRFLDTWYFCISVTGHLYVRPLHPTITSRDVHAFLRRLDVLGEDRLPDSMTFDFSRMQMEPRRWRRITDILRGYARQINSDSMVIFDHRLGGGIALIPRSISRPRQLASV